MSQKGGNIIIIAIEITCDYS